jgi:sugar lactone lactonase YvrE
MSLNHCHWKTIETTLTCAGVLFLLTATGCRSPVVPSPADRSLMWPPPPAQPRIAFEKSITKPSDFGFRRSWWKSTLGYIVGHNQGDLAFIKPTGVCLDESGNLCVTDTGTKTVWFFDMARKRHKRWNQIGRFTFSSPVAVAKKNGVFYVADSGLGAIIAFNEKGKLLFTITEEVKRPSGVALFGQTLCVTDAAHHRIEIFDLQGRHSHGFGLRGPKVGEFNYPTHLAITKDTNPSLYVTDAMNFRIQKVDLEGRALQSIGSIGTGTGSFSRPKGVAIDRDGNLYVVDALFDNIQIFDKQKRFLMHWGESGTEPGCFWLPTGIAIDAEDRIWVADSYNRRIQVFRRVVDHEEI